MADRARCPRIYAHEARLFLRFAGDPALADRVGFDRDELEALDGSVPIVSLYDLVEAAVELTDDSVFGFHAGVRFLDQNESREGAGAFGLMIFASPTMRVAMTTLFEQQSWWNPGEHYDFTESGDHYYIRYHGWGPHRPAHDQLALRNLASMLGTSGLIEGGVNADRARFAMARPEAAAEVEAAARCPIEWDAGMNEMTFPRRALDQPLLTADPTLFRYSKAQLAEQEPDSLAASSHTAMARRELARHDFHDTPALVGLVARRLGLSVRTLQRRLSDEGTSMRELISEARRSRSVDLLREDLTLKEVGERLGYSETAAFRHAFQRWFGRSPAEWRQREARDPT